MGPLKALTTNSHYFADATGKAVYLTGSHTWDDFQDTDLTTSPAAFDFNSFVSFLKGHGHNATILWRKDLPTYCAWGPGGNWHMSPFPWQRTGGSNGKHIASDGLPAFDFTQFNQAYFDRLRSRVVELQQNGIYAIVQLFDGLGLAYYRCSIDGYPFTGGNNVNGIDDGGGTNSMTMTSPNAITNVQDAYVEHVIDTLNDLPNVLWEISEEAPDNSVWWQGHMIGLIHSYEAGKPYQHPVGFPSLSVTGASDSTLYNSNADWVAPQARISPTSSCGSGTPTCKVNFNDTDHSYYGLWEDSYQTQRNYIWENFTNGANVLLMDPYVIYWPPTNRNFCGNPVNGVCTSYLDSNWENFRNNLGYTASYANRVNLALMTPQGGLSSTGFCLANAASQGAQFLVYAPSGGSFTVNLSATQRLLGVEWFNPANGTVTSAGTIAGGSRSQSFTPPGSITGDAVLYLYDSGAVPPDTTPPTVPANVTATAVSSSQINLSWTASTDNVAVAGYYVYRGGTQIASVSGTTYSDTGLAASTTYTYTVAAYDPSGNISARSTPASATTKTVTTTASIQLLQHEGIDCGTTSSCSLSFQNSTTPGDLIVVGLRIGHDLGTVTITDSAGNPYTQVITRVNPNDVHQLYIFCAQNIRGGSATVQVKVSTSDSLVRMTIAEYSGIASSGALDQTTSNVGGGTAVNSGTVTTTQPNELLVGIAANSGGVAWSAGPNWTIHDSPANKLVDADQIVTSTVTTSAQFTLAVSDYWTAAIATFKAAAQN
jgi:hypothetical protein